VCQSSFNVCEEATLPRSFKADESPARQLQNSETKLSGVCLKTAKTIIINNELAA